MTSAAAESVMETATSGDDEGGAELKDASAGTSFQSAAREHFVLSKDDGG